MTRPAWFPDWTGKTVIIVASGPSASSVDLTAARERARFIAVNNSWVLCPWGEILVAADYKWWVKNDGARQFAGLRVSIDGRACREFGAHRLACTKASDGMLLDNPGVVGWGGNSGYVALNLAAQLMPRRIILVGVDASIDAGLHWHGTHVPGLGNPRGNVLARWRRAFDAAAKVLNARGITVINASLESAIVGYPKMPFLEALAA